MSYLGSLQEASRESKVFFKPVILYSVTQCTAYVVIVTVLFCNYLYDCLRPRNLDKMSEQRQCFASLSFHCLTWCILDAAGASKLLIE